MVNELLLSLDNTLFGKAAKEATSDTSSATHTNGEASENGAQTDKANKVVHSNTSSSSKNEAQTENNKLAYSDTSSTPHVLKEASMTEAQTHSDMPSSAVASNKKSSINQPESDSASRQTQRDTGSSTITTHRESIPNEAQNDKAKSQTQSDTYVSTITSSCEAIMSEVQTQKANTQTQSETSSLAITTNSEASINEIQTDNASRQTQPDADSSTIATNSKATMSEVQKDNAKRQTQLDVCSSTITTSCEAGINEVQTQSETSSLAISTNSKASVNEIQTDKATRQTLHTSFAESNAQDKIVVKDIFRFEFIPESPVRQAASSIIDISNISSTSRDSIDISNSSRWLRTKTKTCTYVETSSSEDSGSEYNESDDRYESESDSSDTSYVIPVQNKIPSSKPVSPSPQVFSNIVSSTSNSGSEVNEEGSKEEQNVFVRTTNNEGSRTWDKVDYCIFCEESKSKLSQHIQTQHKNESEVIDWIQTKDNKLRIQKLKKMRNIGNHRHNCKVLREGKGELIVTYRPSPSGYPAKPSDYGPCPNCYAYLVKREMWKHRCPEKVPQTQRRKVIQSSNLLLPATVSTDMSQHLQRVLSSMKSDSVARCIKSDALIVEVASKECFKLGHNSEQDSYIREKLRELGRLVLQLRETFGDENASLLDFINPEKFQQVLKSVRTMCGFSDSSHTYINPSLALKVGHTLKKVSTVVKGQALERGDDILFQRASGFLDLCGIRWTEEISSHALRTLYQRKRNSPQLLPLTSDIVCLANYTKSVAAKQLSILQNKGLCKQDLHSAWVKLAEATLTRVITFNRRRQGEASKLKLVDYKSCSIGAKETALEETLTTFEKTLCKSLSRVEIVGKRGNTVPVILTSDMRTQIDMLVATRDQAGISADNPYVFARTCYGSLSFIRGADCLRKLSETSGADKPETLRSTRLRKHIATVSQILHLDENELEVLAKFMGHDIRTHRAYYRLPDETMQLAKMTKFLLNLEKPGSLTEMKGKSWKDMQVSANEGKFFFF